MAARHRRIKYLAALVVAFTYVAGGLLVLPTHPLASYIVLFAGLALLSYSATGLFRPAEKKNRSYEGNKRGET